MNRGNGLFTRHKCRKGLLIPILGRRINDEELIRMEREGIASHTWSFSKTQHIGQYIKGAVDGRILPGDDKADLYAAMTMNEPAPGEEPNCIFKEGCILLCRTLEQDEELTIWYGNGEVANAQRFIEGYTVDHDLCDPDFGE